MARITAADTPWALHAEAVGAAARTDIGTGLTPREAAARLEADGPNSLTHAAPVPAWRRFVSQFADPLVYLLLAAIGISLVAWWAEGREGVPYDVLVIAVVVIANAVLGFAQEGRSARAVESLSAMAAPSALVRRAGEPTRVAAADVVVGDVLLLAEGDAVAADARLADGAVWAAEAALTGESAPAAKSPAAVKEDATVGDRTSMVHAGTAVTRGAATAVVTATGMDTETGRIAALLASTEVEPTPLQREIARLGRTLGVVVVIIAVVVMGTVFATRDVSTLPEVVAVLLLGVALAVAAVPEGLPAIMSVVLALGVQRMARRHAIVKDLASVETLGSASVICSDKTGTLTQNRMSVRRVLTAGGTVDTGRDARARIGDGEAPLDHDAAVALAYGSLASDAVARRGGGDSIATHSTAANDVASHDVASHDVAFEGDPTETALLEAEYALEARHARHGLDRIGSVPFSAERRRMSVVAAHPDGGTLVAVKGAPDAVLPRCTHALLGGEETVLDEATRTRLEEGIAALAGEGMRTLAVAYRRDPDAAPDRAATEALEHDLVLAGVAGIVDPPRTEARDAVAAAQGAGIRVAMITGDHPGTAVAIAAELGIVPDAEAPVLAGAVLARLSDQELREAVRTVSVFARVAPEDKLRIVDALQSHGEVVAMTGDGVNDAPALRSADIGVAMGRGGTEVAREAAAMILTDDDFATIVTAVREGRGILDNIQRFLRYLLASNLGEVLAVFLGVVAAGVFGFVAADGSLVAPLLATQILWINLLTDLGPALAVSAERYADDLMARRPRPLVSPLVDRAMWGTIAWTGAWMAAATLLAYDAFAPGGLIEGDADVTTARTAAFTVLVLAHLTNAFSARSDAASMVHRLWTNPWLWGAVALSVALQIAVVHVPALNDAFSTAPLTLAQWGACALLALVVPIAIEARKAVLRLRSRRGATVRAGAEARGAALG
ncbi:cation-transporting P-type ATPase [Demequina sp. NBRC 110052]|uniref:cation-translocating P-type ATPase n=1 Tax=Demequina sp. NBRC 110052 TaxID=1570341 RepID=UPI000A06183C|nr:cation-transporting P-type ATPase [Demequina sp. NBRC 110052]